MVYEEPVDTPFVNSVFYELDQHRDLIPTQVLQHHVSVFLLFKLTDDDSFSRLAALDWLRGLDSNVVYSRARLRQSYPSIHVHAVQHVCRIMADRFQEDRCWIVAECGARVEQLQMRRHTHGVIAASLAVALDGIKLLHSSERGYSAETFIVLSNLVWITVQLEEAVEEHLQESIAALCGQGERAVSNVQVLLRFLLDCNQHVQHQRMLDATHRLVAFIYRLHPDLFWNEACKALTPNSAISLTVKPFIYDQDAQLQGAYIPDLRGLLAYGREDDNPISASALLLTFLALCGISQNVSDEYRAFVLHVAALHITSLWPPAQDAATSLLEDVLEDQPATIRTYVPADVLDMISLHPAPPPPPSSSTTPGQEARVPLLAEWRRVALLWSTSVPVRGFACQSFVIFRQLDPPAEAPSLAEILGRLSGSISDSSDDVSLFSIEALKTIRAMTQQLVLSDEMQGPNEFAVVCMWTCLASMTSVNEAECCEGFSLMSVLLGKIAQLQDENMVDAFLTQQPADWDYGHPDWSLSILLALHCSTTSHVAMRLIQQLLELDKLARLYDEDRWLGLCFVAMLPHFVLSLESEGAEPSDEVAVTHEIASALANRFASRGVTDLQRTCEGVANARFKIIDDLIRQGVNGARVHYVPQLIEPVVYLLFGSALTPDSSLRAAALKVTKAFVESLGPTQTPLLAELSSDIWIPLLLALHIGGPSAQDALSCLNLTSPVPGGPNALQLLRLRRGFGNSRSRANTAIGLPGAAEDNTSNRFFGPVSATGWSCADAHEATVRTRSNLASTFRRCEQNLDIVPAAVHVNFVEAGDVTDASIWNMTEDRTKEATPGPGGTVSNHEDELEDIVAQLHDLSNFFVAGVVPPQQLGPSSYRGGGLSRNSSVHLSRSNTQSARDPQKQVAKVLSRAAAYSGPSFVSRTEPRSLIPSETTMQNYATTSDPFALAMAAGGQEDALMRP